MRVYGCDIGAKEIILHDGEKSYYINKPEQAKEIIKEPAIVVLEQTGAYGIRWCEVFSALGCQVYIADGRDFKNFRLAHSKKKDDTIDAFYLRKYYQEKPQKCRPYQPQQTHIRALIRQHIRNEKDITKHTNRLKQYLAVIFPLEEYHLLTRSKFFKTLPELEKRLKETPHTLSDLALSELRKLTLCLEENKRLEQEIISIARNHPDYPILSTFPIGDLQIATLLAYSWDINTFKNKDSYIAYVLMGANLEQSGTSIYRVKTDKARTEIKGIFYPLYMQAHRKTYTHPLKPLADFIRDLVNARHNYKKRYIKFLSRLLELTYYARKERTDYLTTLKNKLIRLNKELTSTQKKTLTETRSYKLYRLTRSISTLRELINLAQGKDISCSQLGEEHRVYLSKENQQKEVNHGTKQKRHCKGDLPPPQKEPPRDNPTANAEDPNPIPSYLKRKSFRAGNDRPPPPIWDT